MKSKIQSVLIPKVKSKLHAVNFPKQGFTLKQSHQWLKKHNYKIPKKIDETINFYRYRQKLPEIRYTYTTEVLPNGVELVLMWRKPKLEGGAKRQVYTPEPDVDLIKRKQDLNRITMELKPWKVFQLKELIQKYNEDKNLNIKYKIARRDKLIETIFRFNINPNAYEISQVNPRQPLPTNVLKKYGIKPNTEAEQKEYEDELSQVKTPYQPRQDKNKPAEVKNLLTLQEHQEKFIKQFIFSNLRGAIVYHGVGSGKTLTAVVSSYFYLLMYPTHKVVVISPSALLYNFINSMIQYGLNIADNRYKFLTYEKFVRNPIDPKTKKLLINKDTLVIIDEAHNFRTEIIKTEIRNPETDQIISTAPITNKRGFTIMEAGTKFAHKVLLLTGTPFVNTLYDIENLLSMIEKRDPLNKASYFNMLSVPENISDYFNYKISYVKSPKSEFFPEYKPHIIGIPMTDQEEDQYRQIKEVGKFEYDDDGEMVFTGKDSEKPNAYYSAERYATNAIGKENNPKIKKIIELIKEKPTQKFIIYSALQDAGVQLLKKALTNIKVEYVVISGSETTRAKEESRRNFNSFYSDTIPKSDDPLNKDYLNNRYRVLLITKAGTEGVDTQNCQNLILLDHQWNDATTEQIIARAIRFKSHHALPVSERYVNVYTLLFVFKSEMKYIDRLNEKGFDDYIGIKNEVNEQSLDYKKIQNKKTNSFNSLTNIKERLSESNLKGKTEEEIKKIVSSDFKKLINRFIENMPELKSDFEDIKNNIDETFNDMKKKQKINGLIEIGHKKQRQGIGKKWSADTRQEITVSKYVSSFIVEGLISLLKDKINKKVDFGELDISNLDPSIDLRLFLLAKSKLKNINEFVSKIGNDISVFEKYESKLLPLIIAEETKLKRSLTDEEQIQIYRNVLKNEIQDILKNSYVPPSELIGKRKRLTQDEKQQFYTSIELATEIADLGFDGLEGEIKILEPTAGNGGLIYPLVNNLIKNKDVIFKIDMIEIDSKNRLELEKLESDIVRLLDNRNFLTVVFKQMYDLILMNPPFNLNGKENGLEHNTYDWEFMRRAFACLKVGGSLVCISSKGWCNTTQLKRIFETFKIFGSDYDDYLNFNGELNQNKEVKGSSEMADFKIIRKGEVKFRGSQGKDTGSGFEVDIFKIIKKSGSLDDKILNTVFYRQVDDTSAQLKVSDIDLDNLPKPPEPPKPEPEVKIPTFTPDEKDKFKKWILDNNLRKSEKYDEFVKKYTQLLPSNELKNFFYGWTNWDNEFYREEDYQFDFPEPPKPAPIEEVKPTLSEIKKIIRPRIPPKRTPEPEPKEELKTDLINKMTQLIIKTSNDKIKKALVSLGFGGKMQANKILLSQQLQQNFNTIDKMKKLIKALESSVGSGRKRKGGNIDNHELAKFVDAGYKTKSEAENVDGYVLDKELSTKRDKVYYDPNTGKAVHTIAGTDKAKDWSNNLLIPLGLHQYSNRYKNAEKIQKEANKKYGKDNLSLVSHSQSGNIAQNLAKKKLVGDENITLNPAIIGSHNPKLKVVKSSGDVVSALTFTNKKDKVIKSKTWNPLTEHSTKILTRKKK